jgi:tubulin-specific chaperone E
MQAAAQSGLEKSQRNAGSFIRPTANIDFGTSFLDALQSKYVEALHGSGSEEKVILGSSKGAIEVEAVRLDKIRSKFSDLRRLKEVSLDNEMVARPNAQGQISGICPSQ